MIRMKNLLTCLVLLAAVAWFGQATRVSLTGDSLAVCVGKSTWGGCKK